MDFNSISNRSYHLMWMALICFSGLSIYISSCQSKDYDERPHVILISVDDMGWSDLGCYGSEINTPNLDSLAFNGIRFTQFYNTSKCFPSRASLLTGVYAQDCGYDQTFSDPIRHAVTLGEVLGEAGYSTYWSGKHHGSENPINRGFDRYYGLNDGACNHFNPGNQRPGEPAPARKRDNRKWAIDHEIIQPYTPPSDFYTTDYFTDYAIDFLKEGQLLEQPVFLYLAYTAPHDPIMAWPEDISKYKGVYDLGYEHIRRKRFAKQQSMGLVDKTYSLSEPTFPQWESLTDSIQQYESKVMQVYAAMIDRLDQNIGRLLGTLRELNMAENTLIMFVSDNGASAEMVRLKDDDDTAEIGTLSRWISLGSNWANVSNTPFRYFKNYPYEGGINTPLIAYWPKAIESSGISQFPGHFIDFMATVVEVADATYPKSYNEQPITPMRGESLVPAFNSDRIEREKPLFFQWRKGQAMREGPFKIVRNNNEDPWAMYNLQVDPTETMDISQEDPARLNSMSTAFEEWLSQYTSQPIQ